MTGYRRLGRGRRHTHAQVVAFDRAYLAEQRAKFLADRRTRRGWRQQRAAAEQPKDGA